jgi:hypothetical protein
MSLVPTLHEGSRRRPKARWAASSHVQRPVPDREQKLQRKAVVNLSALPTQTQVNTKANTSREQEASCKAWSAPLTQMPYDLPYSRSPRTSTAALTTAIPRLSPLGPKRRSKHYYPPAVDPDSVLWFHGDSRTGRIFRIVDICLPRKFASSIVFAVDPVVVPVPASRLHCVAYYNICLHRHLH